MVIWFLVVVCTVNKDVFFRMFPVLLSRRFKLQVACFCDMDVCYFLRFLFSYVSYLIF